MPFTQLFVWVEGPDDQRFVENVFRPILEDKFDWVEVVPYAGMTKDKTVRWIESIRAMQDASYVFLADNDEAPCVSERKLELIGKVKSLQSARISIVVEEIEAWYLAGLTAAGRDELEINEIGNTDGINKEAFDLQRREAFDSRVDWMVEMLRYYSLEEGVARNSSLRYFSDNFLFNAG